MMMRIILIIIINKLKSKMNTYVISDRKWFDIFQCTTTSGARSQLVWLTLTLLALSISAMRISYLDIWRQFFKVSVFKFLINSMLQP